MGFELGSSPEWPPPYETSPPEEIPDAPPPEYDLRPDRSYKSSIVSIGVGDEGIPDDVRNGVGTEPGHVDVVQEQDRARRMERVRPDVVRPVQGVALQSLPREDGQHVAGGETGPSVEPLRSAGVPPGLSAAESAETRELREGDQPADPLKTPPSTVPDDLPNPSEAEVVQTSTPGSAIDSSVRVAGGPLLDGRQESARPRIESVERGAESHQPVKPESPAADVTESDDRSSDRHRADAPGQTRVPEQAGTREPLGSRTPEGPPTEVQRIRERAEQPRETVRKTAELPAPSPVEVTTRADGTGLLRLVTGPGEAAVWLATEQVVNAMMPGFGWTVRLAYLLAGLIDSAIGLERGQGFDARLPMVVLANGMTIDMKLRLFEHQSRRWPTVGVAMGWESQIVVSEPVWFEGRDDLRRVRIARVDAGPDRMSFDDLQRRYAQAMYPAQSGGQVWDQDAWAVVHPTAKLGYIVAVDPAGQPRCPAWFDLPTTTPLNIVRCSACGGTMFGTAPPGDVPCRCRSRAAADL